MQTDLNANTVPQAVTEGTDAIVTLATEGPVRFVDINAPSMSRYRH